MEKPQSQINKNKVKVNKNMFKTKFNKKNIIHLNLQKENNSKLNKLLSPQKMRNNLANKFNPFQNNNKNNNNIKKKNPAKNQNENKIVKPSQVNKNKFDDIEKEVMKKNFIISKILNELKVNSNNRCYLERAKIKKPQMEKKINIQNIINKKNKNKNKNKKDKKNIIKNAINKKAKNEPKKEIKKQNQENNEVEKEKKIFSINDLYKSPTLIGLNNIGATCFMNSTLQCLSQTKELTNYFINKKNKEKIINNNIALSSKNDFQLSPVYLELIQKLWDKNGPKSFSPNAFMNTVNNMNPLFKTGQAGDAKDFIIFILEQLHKELKKSVQLNNNTNVQPLNQYDKDNALSFFFNEFKNNCSIISDIFFGFTETTNECLNCKNKYNSQGMNSPICYNYGIFNCLIFPLEEVKNMKNNSMQNNNIQINNNRVSIYECFFYNQKSELFTEENRNYCNICNQLFDSIYSSKIFISPNVLILILNRGRGNIYDVKLDFSEIIDITQFIQQKDVP